MFQKIQDLIDDKEALVFVLIDEVESLTAARNACRAGAEPSDAIRVVNAVLTQIDQIKRHSNVVILTTSNITEKIDVAFVDRADIKQYIGPPSRAAIFRIYLSCLEELMKCQIIYPRQQLLTLRELEMIGFIENNVSKLSLLLSEISRKSEGLSGRVLRKLPFLAHALYIQAPSVTIEGFLQALSLAVDKQFEEKKKLSAYVWSQTAISVASSGQLVGDTTYLIVWSEITLNHVGLQARQTGGQTLSKEGLFCVVLQSYLKVNCLSFSLFLKDSSNSVLKTYLNIDAILTLACQNRRR